MVRISEIAEEVQKKDGDPKDGDGDEAAGGVPGELQQELEEAPQGVQPVACIPEDPTRPPSPPLSEGLKKDPAAPPAPPAIVADGKALPNDYALRVACIMRSYLCMRQGGSGEAASAAGDGHCRAMMEVVRNENGRWSVSKVILEHTHDLIPPLDPAGSLASLVPTVGMEFDSISAAKAYYGAYSEKMGFQMKCGSGKRSRGNRMLIMQRLSCSKGHFSALNATASNATKKLRRSTYKKGTENAEARKEGEAVEVIQVESSTEKEKGGFFADDHRGEVQSASAETVNEGVNVPLFSNPAQSRLLRELGVRVSRYTSEERRNIILKYVQKRNNRQAVDRSIKIPSRQALAERRKRGIGGKFLSREETQCSQLNQEVESDNTAPKAGCDVNNQSTTLSLQSPKTTPEEATEDEPELPVEVVANAGGVPIVGMIFENEDKAYDYYIKYAGTVGFSVRKGWWDRSAKNVTRSRVYVCSREGFRSKHDAKRPRPETRTGCPARMAIKVTSRGNYRVTEFVPDHNHQLVAPLDIQMLSSRRVLTKIQHIGCQNANLIPAGYKNYLRAKRSKDLHPGDSGALLYYFQKMKSDNPSFYYAIQVDEYDQITNIFWADAKSMMDYHYFGDIVCFDTTYKAHGYGRPLTLFLGLNHHKQVIIFAAAFLYDESLESLKWLFESFKMAMSGKQPKTILTEQSTTMSDAIAAVLPDSFHRLCAFQMYHNTVKHLDDIFQGSESFAHDFSHCLYDVEDEEEFLLAWKLMVEKYDLQDNEWLNKIFEEKRSWSYVFDKQAFSGDIANALRAENLSNVFKDNLNLEKDLSSFLKLYEILLEERRFEELQADFHANQGTPGIPPLPFLWQAVNAYTPAVFEIFKREFEIFLNCMIFSCGEVGTISEYQVTVKEKNKTHYVRFDASDCSAICSCRKFESVGIPCCHVLKVLDIRNVKELPPHYFLKRWRKDAKAGSLRGDEGIILDGDPTSLSKRYSSLCQVLFKIAAKAAENVDTFVLMVNHSDQLLEQVDRILQTNHIEKSSVINTSKDQPYNLVESGGAHYDNGSEVQRLSGKRKNNSVRRKHQNETEVNKRQKTRKGQSDEAEVASRDDESQLTPSSVPTKARNPSNQLLGPSNFMQAPFVSPHQFGLGTTQGFPPMAQFGQDASTSSLQQQPFPGNSHLSQSFPPPYINALQFIGSNPQIDHQNSDQGHCSIPVWDFL